MKCKIPEISWHNRDPVLTVDIQPKEKGKKLNRLATGGTDAHVLIWYLSLTTDGSDIELDLASDLTRHQRAVNTVKWSPNGELLASGDDESFVIIWKLKSESEPINVMENCNDQDKEVWLSMKVLRGHMEDVYDLSWAPNSQFLASGSVDNSAMIWDVHKGKSTAIFNEHKGFVQGVAWDPKNQYIATLSTDRFLRIFDIQSKRCIHRVNKSILPVPEKSDLHNRKVRLFHDDTLQTFFRRLSFTPDGNILLTPAGVAEYEGCTRPINTTYAFSRYAFKSPSIVLPSPDQYTVAVRCCPLLFRLRAHNPATNPPAVPLPYRMIFAVATRSSVYFYDTQQRQPFAVISNIHYTRLTDIAWSSDGRIVVVSSTDGFCSLITFEDGELGEEYEESSAVFKELPANDILNSTKKAKKSKENETQGQKTRKSPPKVKAVPEKNKEAERAELKDESSNEENCKLSSALPLKSIPLDIIIDKEILSSDEKFESPEKKSRPVTPISVRRHPRTPQTETNETVANVNRQQGCSPLSAVKSSIDSPGSNMRAKPIAIRRTPRSIIPTPAIVDAPAPLVEEAMDAWPLNDESNQKPGQSDDQNGKQNESDGDTKTNDPQTFGPETTTDRTEDICLVYEDTQEEASNHQNPEGNIDGSKQSDDEKGTGNSAQADSKMAGNKTPRRVALTTISTPKSKKKLLN